MCVTVGRVKNGRYLGCVAQLAEHWIPNPKVVGSNPAAFMISAIM